MKGNKEGRQQRDKKARKEKRKETKKKGKKTLKIANESFVGFNLHSALKNSKESQEEYSNLAFKTKPTTHIESNMIARTIRKCVPSKNFYNV